MHNFAWQAQHLAVSNDIFRGREDVFGTGLALVARFVDAAAVCVADVALGDVDNYFMWQARQLATFCVTGVTGVTLTALGWLWWRAWFPVVDAAPVFMQGYFLNIEPYFSSQALRIVMSSFFGWQAWHLATSTFPIPLWYATPEPTLPRHTTSFTHHFVIPSSFKHCLWHTIFHTQPCHRQLLTHHCVTHCLSYIIFYHNFFHTQRCHALSF